MTTMYWGQRLAVGALFALAGVWVVGSLAVSFAPEQNWTIVRHEGTGAILWYLAKPLVLFTAFVGPATAWLLARRYAVAVAPAPLTVVAASVFAIVVTVVLVRLLNADRAVVDMAVFGAALFAAGVLATLVHRRRSTRASALRS